MTLQQTHSAYSVFSSSSLPGKVHPCPGLKIVFQPLLIFLSFLSLYAVESSLLNYIAGSRNAVGSASDSRARGPGLVTRSGHILSLALQLILEGQLSAKICALSTSTRNTYHRLGGLSLARNSVV